MSPPGTDGRPVDGTRATTSITAPIGVFDSGIGGLTVASEIAKRLPHEGIRYLGDTARLPYGTKSDETVRRYASRALSFLVQQDVKAVVIACNTASSIAAATLREQTDLPVLGVVEPGARAAVAASESGCIGVIGQEGTIRSGSYESAILALAPEAEVVSRSCPLLVPLAEVGWVDNDVATLVVEKYLAEFADTPIDTLVLGCTHYPLFKGLIAEAAPRVLGRSLALVDSATTVTDDLIRDLEAMGALNPDPGDGQRRFYMTDLPERFEEQAARFFGAPFDHAEQVDL